MSDGSLIAGRQGGLLAADRRVRGSARQVDALLGGVPLYLKFRIQTFQCFCKIAQLEIVVAVDGVRSQISLCAVECYLVAGNMCGRVGEFTQGGDGVLQSRSAETERTVRHVVRAFPEGVMLLVHIALVKSTG